MPSSKLRVLIVGAGVSGLALAQGLKQRAIDFAVFERDIRLDSRGQGYRLKIVGDVAAKLRELVTPEAWTELEATSAETRMGETTVNATDAGVTACRRIRAPASAPVAYTVDRGLLRSALMRGIEDRVYFGKAFSSYAVRDEENVQVMFADGTIEHGSVLVGADGGRSRVRRQLAPDFKIIDTGGCCIYGKTPLCKELLEHYPEQCHRWMTVVSDRTPALQEIIFGNSPITLVSEPVRFKARGERSDLPEDYIHWGVLFHQNTPGLSAAELDRTLQQQPVDLSHQLTEMWHPSIRQLMVSQDSAQTSGMRVTSVPMQVPVWTSMSQVTLMGDAAHVMSPAGGVGAATAINDAWKLCLNISSKGVSAESIVDYESFMRDGAELSLKRTYRAGVALQNQQSYDLCSEVDY